MPNGWRALLEETLNLLKIAEQQIDILPNEIIEETTSEIHSKVDTLLSHISEETQKTKKQSTENTNTKEEQKKKELIIENINIEFTKLKSQNLESKKESLEKIENFLLELGDQDDLID